MPISELIGAIKLTSQLAKGGADGSKSIIKGLLGLISDSGIKGARKAARDSTLFFPVVITSGAGTDNGLATILRTIQNFNLAMMSLAIGNNNIVDLGSDDSKLTFLRTLHSNLDLGGQSILASAGKALGENTSIDTITLREIYEHCDILQMTINADTEYSQAYTEECQAYLFENTIDDEIVKLDENIHKNEKKIIINQEEISSAKNKIAKISRSLPRNQPITAPMAAEIDKLESLIISCESRISELQAEIKRWQGVRSRLEKQSQQEKQQAAREVEQSKTADQRRADRQDEADQQDRLVQASGNSVDSGPDWDPDKLAGIPPSILTAEVVYRHPETGRPEKSTIMFGVKTVPHMVTSKDAIQYLADTYKSGKPIFQLIRWTTGEIRLIRDVFLNVNQARFEALSKRKNQAIWGRLRAYTQLGRVRNLIGVFLQSARKSPIIPNTTLVMSRVEVDTMRIETGVDLMKTPIAAKICDKLGFVEIYITEEDEKGEVSALVFDREAQEYTPYTYALLKKSSRKDAMDTREVISLLKR
jgi:hypothetical protein